MTAPFERKESIDKPGIIGARWWQESIATQVPRRQAVTGLVALGGVLAAMAAIGTCVATRSSGSSGIFSTTPDVTFEQHSALDMQKTYGWNFGATDEPLVFDGKSTKPFDRSALGRILTDLSPADAHYAPFFVPTLFDSVSAVPKSKVQDDATSTFTPLSGALVPISTPATEAAFKQGQSLASLLDKEPRAKDLAVIVDLPGPEAVAFAAGASSVLDPVFLIDNWPHPRGVVPAHLTLASAAYYQPVFAAARASRARSSGARPMFVLDRDRLAKYTDDATQFDNRHVARVPSAESLPKLGVRNVLYVPPNAVQRQELDDLVNDFFAYSNTANVPIHVVPATGFEPSSVSASGADAGAGAPADAYYYGGSPTAHRTFWTHWASPPSNLSTNDLELYKPTRRTTAFAGTPATGVRPVPPGFGMIPVAIAVGTGIILGAKLSRSGSWNRTSSSSSGS